MPEDRYDHGDFNLSMADKCTDSLERLYRRYKDDPNATFEKGELKYYRILQSFEFMSDILVCLDVQMNLHMGDMLIDENGMTYKIKGFEMIRFVDASFPDWYLKVQFVLLSGETSKIGEYLAKERNE